MDSIILKDFEVLACHGVNPEEKVDKQRFLITAEIVTDFTSASETDDISNTVSYSELKKDIKAFCDENSFNLIETLGVKIAERILKKYAGVKGVELTVKKPDAPMSGNFDYAGVKISRKWHRVYLSLGSNLGDKNGYLDLAVNALKADDNFKGVKESKRMRSAQYGGYATEEFLNSVVECETLYNPRKLLAVLQGIEDEGGRDRTVVHWGNRTLDLDILFYDREVICEKDLCIPHPDMVNRFFVLYPFMEFNCNFVHPVLNKRMSELYDYYKNNKIRYC